MDELKPENPVAEILIEWDRMGLPITEADKGTIRAAGLADVLAHQESSVKGYDATETHKKTDGRKHLWLYPHQPATNGEDTESYWAKCDAVFGDKWKNKEITKEDWCAARPDLIDAGFRKFINSHLPRFDRLIPYERFYLYIEQSRRWKADGVRLEDLVGQDRKEYVQQEFRRCRDNRLYGMDKYIFIKDEYSDDGIRDYEASTPQALALFVIDNGHSVYLGKGRQAALTSTFIPAHLLLNLTKSMSKVVLVTDDLETKAKNIFEDKYKFSFQYLPAWFRPKGFGNFSSTRVMFDFAPGVTKAERKKTTADFNVAASHDPTAINGMTPTVLLLDEAQGIPTFDKLIMEAKPTMMSFQKGGLKRTRQLIAFGTGASGSKGKGAFEGAYGTLLERWDKGEDTRGYIPLFLDWTCRPGMTQKEYDAQYADYVGGRSKEAKGMLKDEAIAIFSAHYPESPQDMFMASHKTVVPPMMIKEQQELVVDLVLGTDNAPVFGYFRPLYDESQKMAPGSYHHAFIRSVEFVPTPEDPDAPVQMFLPPVKGWIDRYWQGTDPVQSDGGTSKMASAIWDAVGVRKGGCHDCKEPHLHPTVACILNMRTNDINETYTQTALMGMYYRNHNDARACKELVEYNQGHLYIKDFKGRPFLNLNDSLVMKAELPGTYKNGKQNQTHGVLMQGPNKSSAYRDLTSLLWSMYREKRNIWFYDFWTQLKTIEVDTKEDDSVDWGTIDYRKFNDDLVFAVFFSHLCYRCYGRDPKQVNVDAPAFEIRGSYKRTPRGLRWTEEKVAAYAA